MCVRAATPDQLSHAGSTVLRNRSQRPADVVSHKIMWQAVTRACTNMFQPQRCDANRSHPPGNGSGQQADPLQRQLIHSGLALIAAGLWLVRATQLAR